MPCSGPLVWLPTLDDAGNEIGAVLECCAIGCDYVISTGAINDPDHADAPVLRDAV